MRRRKRAIRKRMVTVFSGSRSGCAQLLPISGWALPIGKKRVRIPIKNGIAKVILIPSALLAKRARRMKSPIISPGPPRLGRRIFVSFSISIMALPVLLTNENSPSLPGHALFQMSLRALSTIAIRPAVFWDARASAAWRGQRWHHFKLLGDR